MKVLLLALAAGATSVLAVPTTAYAQACTRNAAPNAKVTDGEYAIVSFAPRHNNNPNREVSTVHYGPGTTIPATLGTAPFLSGVIVNTRTCVATTLTIPLAPAADPAKQFTLLLKCPNMGGDLSVITGPAVVTSFPHARIFEIEQGGQRVGLEQRWTGEVRLAPGATLKLGCRHNDPVSVVTGYRL